MAVLVGLVIALGWLGRWVDVLTDSVWPAELQQTAGGGFVGALMFKDVVEISADAGFLFTPVPTGGLMIVTVAAKGIGIYLWLGQRTA